MENQQASETILVVDDDEDTCYACRFALRYAGFQNTVSCGNGGEATEYIQNKGADIVLLDLNMPGMPGEKVLEKLHTEFPHIPVIIITGSNELEKAVECMRSGAYDYMVKPLDRERLLTSVRNALSYRRLRNEYENIQSHLLSGTIQNPAAFSDIVTQNETMHNLFRYMEAVAPSSKPFLITGETGVGKGLMARAIHKLSGKSGKMISVDLAGLDDALFSDAIFGHVKGAFTGADNSNPGLIRQAENGSLFLDEIGDLAMPSQVKLLRLIQESEYMPLGDSKTRKTNARIISATNRPLGELQANQRFRRDLFFRLSTHHIHVPPLRERLQDIPLLISHFEKKAEKVLGKKVEPLNPKARQLLQTYQYPGNIRELESIVYDILAQHPNGNVPEDYLRAKLIPEYLEESISETEAPVEKTPGKKDETNPYHHLEDLPSLRESNDMLIREALRRCANNQRQAARILGISPSALSRRLSR